MSAPRLLPVLLAAAALVPACGDDGGETADPASALLSVEAPTVAGGTLDLASLAGKDLALWFWAPW